MSDFPEHTVQASEEPLYDGPSKSQRKRDASALQALGAELAELPPAQLDKIPLDAALREAIAELARTRAHGARKRQMKYVGGLLRSRDAEPIQAALVALKTQSVAATRQHHQLERWRDRLIAEGDAALGELADACPALDRAQIRQLVRHARHEQATNKPPRSARRLFQYLRNLLDE